MWNHWLKSLTGSTLAAALPLFAQTRLSLRDQSTAPDFSQASAVRPLKTGTALPVACAVGEMFFKTDAPSGGNVYGCAATDNWVAQGSGAGSMETGFRVVRTNNTNLSVGADCQLAQPCRARVASQVYVFPGPATATVTSGSGTVYLYISSSGALVAGISGASNPAVTCSGCQVATGVTQFPSNVIPLATWNATNGTWDAAGADQRAALSLGASLAAGANITLTEGSGTITIASAGGPAGTQVENTLGTVLGTFTRFRMENGTATSWTLTDRGAGLLGVAPNLDTGALNASYPQLAANSTYAAGARQTFVQSSSTAGVRILPDSVLPSAAGGGDVAMNAIGQPAVHNGSSWMYLLRHSAAVANAGMVYAGPASGGAQEPSFRALADADVPDTITLTNITQITNRSLSNMTGTVSTAQIANDAVTRDKVSASLRTRLATFLLGKDNGPLLVDADDQASIFVNRLGSGVTITEVHCESDSGTPSINVQRDDGTPANILLSNLLCSSSGAATTAFNGSEASIVNGNSIDFVMVAAGGVAKRLTVTIRYTLD